MRIVSGEWRGSTIYVPDTPDTRPTMDRTRQAVFNILRSASWALDASDTPILHEALVLDVFAGSGAMGFEAVSQGANSAVLFEQGSLALQAIEKNRIKLRGAADKTRVVKGDILKAPKNTQDVADIAFFDPPYHDDVLQRSISVLHRSGWISAKTLLVLEMHKDTEFTPPDGIEMQFHDARIYGTSKILFMRITN